MARLTLSRRDKSEVKCTELLLVGQKSAKLERRGKGGEDRKEERKRGKRERETGLGGRREVARGGRDEGKVREGEKRGKARKEG